MATMSTFDSLTKLKKPELLNITDEFGLKNLKNKQKKELIKIILEFKDVSDKYTPIKINETIYNKIYHISDIHIRPLKRHSEYNEVFNNLYSFLEKDISGNNIIAITGDIIHEKDLLKPETIIICRNFVKKLSTYGTVIIITGNHDMLENNPDRLDNLTAVFDDLPVHYLVNSGAYLFGNIIFTVSSLVDKKFVKKNQVINVKKLPIVALYHGTINGCVNDFGYIIEDTTPYSTRFRKISEFDGYDMVLLGDIHKHQYLKPHIAYPGSLIQQNFGENVKEHGVLIWDIVTKKSNFVPITNKYGFVTIKVINNKWVLPNDIPEKPFIRLLLKNTNNDYSEIIKNELEKKYNLQSFKTTQITENVQCEELPDEVTVHQDDIDIINEEMSLRNISEEKKANILEIHNRLKINCLKDSDLDYNMNNQNWKILKLSFKNVFIFGENKINTIDFTTLNGITTIVGPNAIGKSNIINIIIFLLYGSNINFKVPHILNKYQDEYFIECELMFGAQKFKIKKIGKKRKGNKLNHSFSFYIYEEDKWIQQDKENNKGTSNLVESFLGTVEQFLLTNVYSNSSLRTILTLTNSEKHKALSKLFCLDIYENLEKLAKNDISEIKKQCSFLEGEKKGLLYNFDDCDIKNIQEHLNTLNISLTNEQKEIENINEKINFLEEEKKIIITKKDNLLLNIQNVEYKNYNLLDIQNKINTYKLKYSDILLKENQDLEKLKLNYHTLNSSLIILENNKSNLNNQNLNNQNLNELIKKENQFKHKIKNYEDDIKILQQNYEKNQNIINSFCRKIVNLPEIKVDLKEFDILDKKYINIVDIPYPENKLLNLKSKILNINPINKKIIDLPKNYDNDNNINELQKINNKLYLYSQKADEYLKLKNEFYYNIDKKLETKIDIMITNDIRKSNFDININILKLKIKQLNKLNSINVSKNIIDEEINTLKKQESIINVEKLQNCIDMLNLNDVLSLNDKFVSIDTKNILEIKQLLELIKNNIDNSTFMLANNKLGELLKYKKILHENIEIEKNNFQIQQQIKNLKYNYYDECYQYINYLLSCLNDESETYNNYQYTYQCDIQNECLKIEEKIKYEKIKTYLHQKQQNDNLINECNKYEIELETIKENILNINNNLNNLKHELQQLTTLIKNINIYKHNCETNNKINIIENTIKEQDFRNEYSNLLMLLKDGENYNKIIKKIHEDIKKYSEMLEKLQNEIAETTNLYISIKSNITSTIKDISLKTGKLKELYNIKEKGDNLDTQLNEFKKDLLLYSEYINLVNKNNIPVKLILKKTTYIQDHINIFLEKLTNFTIKIDVSSKNGIDFNAHKNNLILDVNQLSGYETFILNIALKSALNKYSFISKSTLFILDEGLDVVDKDNFKKLDILMKLLMKHYKHILLISHMPKVKDLQHHEVNIQNNGQSSYIATL